MEAAWNATCTESTCSVSQPLRLGFPTRSEAERELTCLNSQTHNTILPIARHAFFSTASRILAARSILLPVAACAQARWQSPPQQWQGGGALCVEGGRAQLQVQMKAGCLPCMWCVFVRACLYACVCVFVCTHMCVQVCARARAGGRGVAIMLFSGPCLPHTSRVRREARSSYRKPFL